MPEDDPQALLRLARRAAGAAAENARALRARGVEVAGTKSSDIDVVTEADRSTEALLRDLLLAARPDDAILGEEGDDHPGTSGVRWILDPIDGTVNYLYGWSWYAVSVAAEVDGEVVAAVVVNPATGEEYAALRGGGATCDGLPLTVRDPVALAQSLVATGFNYEQHVRERQAGAVARMLPRVRDVRRAGSCALDLCQVAAGRLDGYVEEGPEVWDDAAGGLIAREAGARLEVTRGASGKRLVVCAPEAAFDDFAALVRECGFGAGSDGEQPG
ncbi:MAG: inositol monophosphatase family protein [Marmoricola sp.]